MTDPHIRELEARLKQAERAQYELEKRMFHLKTLYEASREISLLTDTGAILTNLLLMIVGTFGAERGLILLRDIREMGIEAMTHRGLDDAALSSLTQAVEQGYLAQLEVWAGSVVVKEREDSDPLSSIDIRNWIPFSVSEHLKGVVGLGDKLTGEVYSADDFELLVTLANQAAIAIQKAKAHEELVRYAEDLKASLRRIQMLEYVKTHLAKFVPSTVQALIEQSPEAPLLDKRETDVSVLFADITGYTRLSAEMEMDRVNQLVELYFGDFLDEIIKHGGDVNETAGDGLMVIFQDADPRTHAMAAVRAALGIQRQTRATNATLEDYFQPIEVHVGINSGIASVGATKIEGVAGTRWTYTASGPTTNVAARLAALCDGGNVVISEETRRRIGDEFEVEDMGYPPLKNVAQAIRVYRLKSCERDAAPSSIDTRR